jgi:hypothetical protein
MCLQRSAIQSFFSGLNLKQEDMFLALKREKGGVMVREGKRIEAMEGEQYGRWVKRGREG